MGTILPVPTTAVTADDLFRFMVQNQINDDRIFGVLCRSLDLPRYQRLLFRIELVNGLAKPDGKSKAFWGGKKSRLKGKLFELLIGIVLESVEPFVSWSNIHTSTSEIDWLVQIGPTANVIPTLREWGTHFICECKFSHDHVSIQWVTNLNTVLHTHNSHVALLFSTRGLTNRGNGKKAVRQIELLSVMTPARFIVCIDSEDLQACATGVNFLQLISQRYVEAKASSGRLRLLRA